MNTVFLKSSQNREKKAQDRQRQRTMLKSGYRTLPRDLRITVETSEILMARAEFAESTVGEIINSMVEASTPYPDVFAAIEDIRESLGFCSGTETIKAVILIIAASNPVLNMIKKRMCSDDVVCDMDDERKDVQSQQYTATRAFADGERRPK